MNRSQPFKIDLHSRRERIIGRILAREECIATAAWDRMEIKNAAHWWLLVAGDVRVPILPGDAPGTRISVDGQDFGMTLRARGAGVNVQIAEIAAKPLVSFDVERLIAKEQDEVLRNRLMQVLDLAVAQRLGQNDAFDLGSDARRDGCDADGLIGHG